MWEIADELERSDYVSRIKEPMSRGRGLAIAGHLIGMW